MSSFIDTSSISCDSNSRRHPSADAAALGGQEGSSLLLSRDDDDHHHHDDNDDDPDPDRSNNNNNNNNNSSRSSKKSGSSSTIRVVVQEPEEVSGFSSFLAPGGQPQDDDPTTTPGLLLLFDSSSSRPTTKDGDEREHTNGQQPPLLDNFSSDHPTVLQANFTHNTDDSVGQQKERRSMLKMVVDQPKQQHQYGNHDDTDESAGYGGGGPSYKDQMREATYNPHVAGAAVAGHQRTKTATTTTTAGGAAVGELIVPYDGPAGGGEGGGDVVAAMIEAAAWVPENELLLEKAMQRQEQRGKVMVWGLYATVLINVLVVVAALLAVFCLTSAGKWNLGDRNDPVVPSLSRCETAMKIDLLANSNNDSSPRKQRIGGTLMNTNTDDQESRSSSVSSPDSLLTNGNWYVVQGTDTALFADTCSPLTTTDTVITVYSSSSSSSSSSSTDPLTAGCAKRLTLVATNDDDLACAHGEEFSRVAWWGHWNETYFVYVSGYDQPPDVEPPTTQQQRSYYSLKIDQFNNELEPCSLSNQLTCQILSSSSSNVDGTATAAEPMACSSLNSPILTTCDMVGDSNMLQFQYQHTPCDFAAQPAGAQCEGTEAFTMFDPYPPNNVTVACQRRPSANNSSSLLSSSSEVFVLNTTPQSVSLGELVTVRSSNPNDPLPQQGYVMECDTRNVNTNELLQRISWDLSQHALSLSDALGSLRLVACGDDDGDDFDPKTCFRRLSLAMTLVNMGSEPVHIVSSALELYQVTDPSSVVEVIGGWDSSTVLNVGASANHTVSDLFDACQFNSARHAVYGTTIDGTMCSPPEAVTGLERLSVAAPLPPTSPVAPGHPPPAPINVVPPLDENDDDDESLLRLRWVQALIAVALLVELALFAYCAHRIFRRCQRQHQDELAILQQKQQQLASVKKKNQQQQEREQQQQNQETDDGDDDAPSLSRQSSEE